MFSNMKGRLEFQGDNAAYKEETPTSAEFSGMMEKATIVSVSVRPQHLDRWVSIGVLQQVGDDS